MALLAVPTGVGVFGHSGSDSDSDSDGTHTHQHGVKNQVERMEDITGRTIQTRLLLLIDLVYRLVLFGSVPAAVDRNSTLSTCIGGGDSVGGDPGKDSKSLSKPNEKESASSKTRRQKSRELYELLSRADHSSGGPSASAGAGETSRTSGLSLRQSLRSSIGNPPLLAGRNKRGRSASGGSLAAAGAASTACAGFSSGGGGGGDGPSPSVIDENRQRKDCRRSTLERVHKLFWTSSFS